MMELRNSIVAGLSFGLIYGILMAIVSGVEAALLQAPITAFLYAFFLYMVSASKTGRQQTALENVAASDIVHSGPANHFYGALASGGRLYLLKDKLVFKSHNFNAQKHQLNIELEVISEIGFYNTLGLVPNGLYVIADGSKQKFVVNDRKFWKREIERVQGKQA